MKTPIFEFEGEFRFLSNFFILPYKITIDGISYTSTEAAYQAGKTLDIEKRIKISKLSPGESKKVGKKLKLREDWLDVRYTIMVNLLRIKFAIPELKALLLDTYPRILIEGNWWHDNFWGYHLGDKGTQLKISDELACYLCIPGCPYNHLGRAIMLVREELIIDSVLLKNKINNHLIKRM